MFNHLNGTCMPDVYTSALLILSGGDKRPRTPADRNRKKVCVAGIFVWFFGGLGHLRIAYATQQRHSAADWIVCVPSVYDKQRGVVCHYITRYPRAQANSEAISNTRRQQQSSHCWARAVYGFIRIPINGQRNTYQLANHVNTLCV